MKIEVAPRVRGLAVAAAYLATLAGLTAGCATPNQGASTADAAAVAKDGVAFDVPIDGAATTSKDGEVDGGAVGDSGGDAVVDGAAAAGAAILTFEVDDSANKSFADGEIVWTGSFSWDSKTNTVTYSTSWLPTDGPYPALYDDGPLSKGGHEREGALKGDHIFSTQVFFAATQDTTIEYGALNELGNWMWIGANGQVPIPKGSVGVIAFKGMKIGAHGKIDVKLALDTTKLNSKFAKWNLKDNSFFVKGSMNMWTPIQLLDDGAKGDDKSGDAVVTYQHSLNLGKHDGGLNAKDEAQFIFVTTTGDQLPDAGLEYKGATEAFKDGISAWTNTGVNGAWEPAAVVLAKDSKGKFLNTAIQIPQPATGGCEPNCPCQPACKVEQTCTAGKCVGKPNECNPACVAGQTCVAGQCKTAQSQPTLDAVDPSKGSTLGGDSVVLTGSGFGADATARFGGTLATEIKVEPTGKMLTCKTSAHAEGLVDVEVENGDGGAAKLMQAFSYQLPPKPAVTLHGFPVDGLAAANGQLALFAIATIAGVTSGAGITPDLQVFVGFGPPGANPQQEILFDWKQAAYAEKDANGGEKFTITLATGMIGKMLVAAKLTWKGEAVYSTPTAITLIDAKELPASFSALVPAFAAASGGATVVLTGVNLAADSAVTFSTSSGVIASGSGHKVVPTGLQVTVPVLPVGPVQVTVKSGAGKTIGAPLPFDAVSVATPVLDATMGADWPVGCNLATNSVVTAWGPNKNELKGLWIGYDKTNLYIGVQGTTEGNNAIVAYLDVDYGKGTGVKSPVDLQDNNGAVDDAVAGICKFADGLSGLDFALASIGMGSFEGTDLAKSTAAGWRGLQKINNFAWLQGTIKGGSSGLEASIPLTTLYPQGIAINGAELRIVVVLSNANGAALSNQFLPEQKAPSDAVTVTTTVAIKVFQLP
ncbi:MAG: hypothetical protein EXR77_05400 [Myxococcales bacterium]|nr:hypothetical protein [Myxococcales bacterium]